MEQKLESYRRILRKESQLYNVSEEIYAGFDKKDVAARNISYIFGPAVFCFTAWVLKKAQKQGIKRLYFLARDGYQFYQCACILCKQWQMPVECRYLECSRYSLRIPLFSRMGDKALDYICIGGIDVTFNKIMHRAGIDDESSKEIAELMGFKDRMQEPMSYRKAQSLKSEFLKCEPFMKKLKEISQAAYPATVSYLRQEGLFDDESYAIVDSGWTGSMQKVLNEFLREEGCNRQIKGFYWGLYELPEGVNKDLYETYYFKVQGDYRRKVYFSNCLFESVFSSPCGMTVGYKREGDMIKACYDSDCGLNAHNIKQQTEKIISYACKASAVIKDWTCEDAKAAGKVLYRLFKSFMGHPDSEEASWYGSYQFSDDVREDISQPVAGVLSRTDLKNNHFFNKMLIMYGIRKGSVHESAWYEASAQNAGKHVMYHQKQYQWYKYLIYIRKNIKGK